MERRYPTKNGIAVSPFELDLPYSGERRENNHHGNFTRRAFSRLAVTEALRNLDRHQYLLPVDTHNYLHRVYSPPEMPTPEQAAREVIDAYEHGEQFKVRGRGYEYRDIPKDLVDGFVAMYSLVRVFDMKPSHASPERLAG